MSQLRARRFAVGVLASVVMLANPIIVPAVAATSTDRVTSHAAPRGAGGVGGALLVRVHGGSTDEQLGRQFNAAGAVEVGRLDAIGVRVVTVAPGRDRAAVRAALMAAGIVVSVEDDGSGTVALTPDDPLWHNQWSARRVRAPQAWDITTGDGGPIIAIIDSGVWAGHPDLEGRVLAGRDLVNDDRNAADDNGHGTLVAGVAAARGMNGKGVAGTCWRCRILPVKVIDSHGRVRWSNAAAGVIWATDRGAQVINMSFGDQSASSALAAAVAYAVNRGVVVVAAAGNDGRTARFYPASYPGVLGVAATNSSDSLYSWSNRGSWVKLAAPGCTWTTSRGGGYTSFCGTSAAAPIVAGIAGLMLSVAPGASATQVRSALRSSAVHVTSKIGGGRVDALAAINEIR